MVGVPRGQGRVLLDGSVFTIISIFGIYIIIQPAAEPYFAASVIRKGDSIKFKVGVCQAYLLS